jgi:two-component system KDP operon response regulator KdpE
MMSRVLVVDDEAAIRHALGTNLRVRGYDVDLASSGEEALDLAARHHPDLVVLDLGLPGIDGIDVVRGLRGWTNVPIVILSARGSEPDKVAALDAGADDYVAKPFGMEEFLARVRAALRRGMAAEATGAAPIVETDHFHVDLSNKQVTRPDGTPIRLTPTEWHMVELLARHPGKLISARQLLQGVWGPSYQGETNSVRVHMAHIRSKLEPEPSQPRYILTEPGMGYRFLTKAHGQP